MENFEIVIWIAYIAVGFLTGAVPTVIALIKSIKSRKIARTEEAKAKADLDIKNYAIGLISEAEELYSVVDVALKAMGGSAGSVKKETVMARLHQYALDNGFAFDAERWSAEIDQLVAMTKVVNAKN